MQVPMDEETAVRMAGYMEKRGKLKLMSSWKKYWFVLKGQLLLYYKSEQEYSNLSACRGSLNIGLASCVRPGQGLTLQVVTRTQCVTLRTKERTLQEQWLQALLDSMALPNTSSLKRNSTGTQHFRYSLDNLPAITETDEISSREEDDNTLTLPRSIGRRNNVLDRIQRMGGVSYNMSPNVIITHTKLTKSKSVPDNEASSDPSKDAFINNLRLVRDLLEETNKKTHEKDDEKSKESPDLKRNSENSSNISMDNSESILEKPSRDENQNTSEELRETKPYEISENNCYQSLHAIQSTDTDLTDDKEVEYSDYDRVALMNTASTQVDEVEPDLPPRPNKEVAEYEELDLTQLGAEKKHSNLRDKMNLFKDSRQSKILKKSNSQEFQVDDGTKTKKRKNSFLKKIVLRLKRKESVEEAQTENKETIEESDEEPIYESVTFLPHPHPELPETDNISELAESSEKQLPPSTIQELKDHMRIKLKEEFQDNEGYDTICLTISKELRTEEAEEPMKTSSENIKLNLHDTNPDHVKSNFDLYAKSTKKNQKSLQSNLEIPSLPAKSPHRPSSPWHDVPTNNAPVDPLLPLTKDSPSESSNIAFVPDNILNTPHGFQLVKNHWQQAEKSGEWNREHQQVAYHNKTQERTTLESTCHSIESLTNRMDSQIIEDGNIITSNIEQLDSLEKPSENVFDKESNEIVLQIKRMSIHSQPNIPAAFPMQPEEETYLIENDIYYTIDNHPLPDLIDLGHTENNSYRESIGNTSPLLCNRQVPNIMDASINDTDEEIVGINRYSDELHLLLTQLAEITSAPLFHIGATKSLIATSDSCSSLDVELGPIRRRRHSDPDYDVPRPHQSLFAQDTPEISMSPDSLEPSLEHFLADVY